MNWDQPSFEALMRLLGERIGLIATPSRRPGMEAGVRRAMRRMGSGDLGQYRDRVATDERALLDLAAELTVGETYFFREPAHFELIRRVVLPEIRERRGAGHVLRAWSAGCSSGEEVYSLAVTLFEVGFAGRAYLLATDVSEPALTKARQGVYSNWSLRGAGAAGAVPYLQKSGDHWIVDDKVRRLVTFGCHNLAQDDYPALATGIWGMDLILCRNVLIYFRPEVVQAVARRLFASLADGGWLITASTDPPLAGAVPFEKVVTHEGVFYRRGCRPSAAAVGRNALPVGTGSAHPRTPLSPLALVPLSTAAPSLPPPPVAVAARIAPVVTAIPDPAEDVVAAQHVRALANLDVAEAERVCNEAAIRHPLSAELHYLQALLLLNLGRMPESVRAARRALFLDRSLAIAQFTLGLTLRRLGDLAGARRGYSNARNLCAKRPADEVVPLSDGIRADRLAQAAEVEIGLIDAMPEGLR